MVGMDAQLWVLEEKEGGGTGGLLSVRVSATASGFHPPVMLIDFNLPKRQLLRGGMPKMGKMALLFFSSSQDQLLLILFDALVYTFWKDQTNFPFFIYQHFSTSV